jgi:hypothetical protein
MIRNTKTGEKSGINRVRKGFSKLKNIPTKIPIISGRFGQK